jgi:hypothetical protein
MQCQFELGSCLDSTDLDLSNHMDKDTTLKSYTNFMDYDPLCQKV